MRLAPSDVSLIRISQGKVFRKLRCSAMTDASRMGPAVLIVLAFLHVSVSLAHVARKTSHSHLSAIQTEMLWNEEEG